MNFTPRVGGQAPTSYGINAFGCGSGRKRFDTMTELAREAGHVDFFNEARATLQDIASTDPRVLAEFAVAVFWPVPPAGTGPLLSARSAETCAEDVPKVLARTLCPVGAVQALVEVDLSAQ